MDDRIELRGLRLSGVCGALPEERDRTQPLEIDLDVHADLRPAGRSDALADTVDYGTLAGRLAEIVAGPPVDLIETLAARLADACLGDARVRAATVTVHKPAAPIPLTFADVAVTIRRTRAAG